MTPFIPIGMGAISDNFAPEIRYRTESDHLAEERDRPSCPSDSGLCRRIRTSSKRPSSFSAVSHLVVAANLPNHRHAQTWGILRLSIARPHFDAAQLTLGRSNNPPLLKNTNSRSGGKNGLPRNHFHPDLPSKTGSFSARELDVRSVTDDWLKCGSTRTVFETGILTCPAG